MKFNMFPARIPITTSLSIYATIISIIIALANGLIETNFTGWSLTIWVFLGLLPCWRLSVSPDNNHPTSSISLALTIVTALHLIFYWNGLNQSEYLYQFLTPLLTLIIFYTLWVTIYSLFLMTNILKFTAQNLVQRKT
jgi:hypothetical protein